MIINIDNITTFLEGKKTYALAFLAIIYALAGYFSGHMAGKETLDTVWVALIAMTGRAGISKAGK